MPQLDSTFYTAQLLWLVILFGVLYSILRYKIFPRLDHIIHKRKSMLEALKDRAQELQHEIDFLRQSNAQKLQAERDQARDQISAYGEKWQREAALKEEELQQLMQTQLEVLKASLEEEKVKALEELKKQEKVLITSIVKKISSPTKISRVKKEKSS